MLLTAHGIALLVVGSAVGKADAAAAGYARAVSLGFVWPPPQSVLKLVIGISKSISLMPTSSYGPGIPP